MKGGPDIQQRWYEIIGANAIGYYSFKSHAIVMAVQL